VTLTPDQRRALGDAAREVRDAYQEYESSMRQAPTARLLTASQRWESARGHQPDYAIVADLAERLAVVEPVLEAAQCYLVAWDHPEAQDTATSRAALRRTVAAAFAGATEEPGGSEGVEGKNYE